jgi:thymidylate synthase (FAD)
MNIVPIFAEYKDHMGSDLSVVNAARASFGKESEYNYVYDTVAEVNMCNMRLDDQSLIKFLATGFRSKEWAEFLAKLKEPIQLAHLGMLSQDACDAALTVMLHAYKRRAQHWAPFAHPHIQIRIQLPLFLARQFVKHQIGGTWSEESRRYLSDEPDVWFPDEWHSRPEDIKQGSGGLVENQIEAQAIAHVSSLRSLTAYLDLLEMKVAPEEARIVLPLNMMTTVVWTGSLLFWSRVVNQRVDSHAQLAAQSLGKKISSIIEPLFPYSWEALTT